MLHTVQLHTSVLILTFDPEPVTLFTLLHTQIFALLWFVLFLANTLFPVPHFCMPEEGTSVLDPT